MITYRLNQGMIQVDLDPGIPLSDIELNVFATTLVTLKDKAIVQVLCDYPKWLEYLDQLAAGALANQKQDQLEFMLKSRREFMDAYIAMQSGPFRKRELPAN